MDVKPPTNAEGDKSPTRIKKRIRGVTPIYPFIDAARSLFAQLGNVVEVTSESDFNLFRPPQVRSQRILPTSHRLAIGSPRRDRVAGSQTVRGRDIR